MTVAEEFAQANKTFVDLIGDKPPCSLPPSRKVAVITCMDARIDPAACLGIAEGEAHVIRNAGGRTHDALRSLLISQHLLETREVYVLHHTDCGMLTFQDVQLREKLKDFVGPKLKSPLAPVIDSMSFLPFVDLDQTTRQDVDYLKEHPLIADRHNITGWVYDVETRKVRQVV